MNTTNAQIEGPEKILPRICLYQIDDTIHTVHYSAVVIVNIKNKEIWGRRQ